MRPWTGSATERILRCPASAALPAVYEPVSEGADRGTAIHAYCRALVTKGRQAALAELPKRAEWRATCEGIDLTPYLDGVTQVHSEVCLAYDVATDTGRILGENLDRAYVLGPTEIGCSLDLVVWVDGFPPRIFDFKTGFDVPHASESDQLRMYALALARAVGVDSVEVGILAIRDDGSIRQTLASYDSLDLGAFAHEVRQAWGRVERARDIVAARGVPDVTVGDHCRYCPAMGGGCPRYVALARSVLGLEAGSVEAAIDRMTPEEGGELWARYKAAEALLERVGAGLRALAAREPLRLPDGRQVVMVEQARETIDGKRALPILRRHGLEGACDVKVSRAALERARGRQKAREVMAELKEAGAVKETTYAIPQVRGKAVAA